MTVENIRSSIEKALELKANESVPRISKREAQHIIKAAEQGAGPDPLGESIFVASFVYGSNNPLLLEMIEGLDISLPGFGVPGKDYTIDDDAMDQFDSFFIKYSVPLGKARERLIEEMKEQSLNLGKWRPEPAGSFYKVKIKDFHGDPLIGYIDAKAKLFYLERPEFTKRGESRYYGLYKIDQKMDPERK